MEASTGHDNVTFGDCKHAELNGDSPGGKNKSGITTFFVLEDGTRCTRIPSEGVDGDVNGKGRFACIRQEYPDGSSIEVNPRDFKSSSVRNGLTFHGNRQKLIAKYASGTSASEVFKSNVALLKLYDDGYFCAEAKEDGPRATVVAQAWRDVFHSEFGDQIDLSTSKYTRDEVAKWDVYAWAGYLNELVERMPDDKKGGKENRARIAGFAPIKSRMLEIRLEKQAADLAAEKEKARAGLKSGDSVKMF